MTVAFSQTEELLSDLSEAPLRFLRVANLDRLIDREALLSDPSAPEPPYWAHLWPAARTLARLVAEAGPRLSRTRVIEIGCGLGLPGLVAARWGASVVLTDRTPAALAFVAGSLERNGLSGLVLAMDWRSPSVRGPFDFCLAADVTYDPAGNRRLVDFLGANLARTGEAWIAESVRAEEVGVPELLRSRFETEEQRLSEREEGRQVWVRVLRARWRR